MKSMISARTTRPVTVALFLFGLIVQLVILGSCSDDNSTGPAKTRGVGLAKTVDSTPVNNGNGTYSFSYIVRVVNTGDIGLTNVRAIDSLSVTFAAAASWSVDTLWSTGFDVNPGFDGGDDPSLLAGGNTLAPGASGNIRVEVTVNPGNACEFNNAAYASGVCECGSSVFDQSTNGTNPDPDGDGNPTNDTEPTTVDLCITPNKDNTLVGYVTAP